MPAPQKSALSQLAQTNFIAMGIKLPVDWSKPGDQYDDAFQQGEKTVTANPPDTLFNQVTLNKYHVESAKTIGNQFAKYIDGISGAICAGIDKWLNAASITGVIINGPTGMLMAGNVIGPPLGPLILTSAPQSTPMEIKYSNAIANAFNTQWQAWHMGLTGVLMYPAFAAFPGPVAPPTPNIPAPLIAFSSAGEPGLSSGTLKNAMLANLGDPQAMHAPELFDAIATAFSTLFQLFKTTTMVQNVLGTGPVPSFAPPVMPAGPVVAGTGNGAPGCIM
jgi:hypothetical protein